MNNQNLKKIKIDIISDNVCPFCFVGKRKIENALQNLKNKAQFEIKWHPYFLNPDASFEGDQIFNYD